MGYNTQILILNDALDQIQKNPIQFVEKLCDAINNPQKEPVSIGVGIHANAVSIIPTDHADTYRILVSHGNWLWEIPYQYATDMKIMTRAKTEKYLRNDLISRCLMAHDRADATLKLLKLWAKEQDEFCQASI